LGVDVERAARVPDLVLSQINRASEKRPDGRPRISDLRESGAIEQHADTVIFAHRPWVHDKTQPEEAAEFIVGKQRNGPIGTVEATFDGPHVTFHGVQRGPSRPDWNADPEAT
jgi:replicative DNA helicase